ncbi:MAG: NTP/NDP exchange transporter [Steroidobacter sp.]
MSNNTNNPSVFTRVLSRLAPIEPREAPAVVAAFFLFFFMWAGYFAVRPVRETIGTLIGREQLADLWIVTATVSILIIPLYGAIVGRFRRSAFLPWIYGVVAAVLAAVAFALQGDTVNLLVGKFFYVFISVVNLFLISMFWSFLLEIFESGQTKRLFGVIAAGGSAGALAGPLASDLSVSIIGNTGVLLLGASLFLAAIFCQRLLLGIWTKRSSDAHAEDRPLGGNVFAGVSLILRSPYLLGIALFIVMISTVNTLLYFEQLRLVEITFPDTTERTRVFARLDWIVQALTVVSQIFLTGRIAQKFGVIALITFVPLLMVFGFLALAASGTFTVLAVVFVLRRACEYAFVRPGREMLWSPLDKETKYKAKNTVDVPVYRGADALAAQVNNAVAGAGFGAASVAVLGAGVAATWMAVGWWLGRRFERDAAAAAPVGMVSDARAGKLQ